MRSCSVVLRVFAVAACIAASAAASSAAVFEIPQNGGVASGIGYFSGWKCPPNDNISIVVDGGAPIPVPSGVRRNDTASACGNDGRNGFISQINFNLFGNGTHTAVVRQNGVQFAQTTFEVTTFGTNFLTGAAGLFMLDGFPTSGSTTTVEWVQGQQNFVITGTSGGGGETVVAVRYVNELQCGNSNFNSVMSANGFVWGSNNGSFSQYQVVTNRSFLGPFVETNNSQCGSPIPYNFTLFIESGRAYTLVQTLLLGGPYLVLNDDGPIDLKTGAAAEPAADQGSRPTLVGGPGVAPAGAQPFSPAP